MSDKAACGAEYVDYAADGGDTMLGGHHSTSAKCIYTHTLCVININENGVQRVTTISNVAM